jgi:hypothetical protein
MRISSFEGVKQVRFLWPIAGCGRGGIEFYGDQNNETHRGNICRINNCSPAEANVLLSEDHRIGVFFEPSSQGKLMHTHEVLLQLLTNAFSKTKWSQLPSEREKMGTRIYTERTRTGFSLELSSDGIPGSFDETEVREVIEICRNFSAMTNSRNLSFSKILAD